MSSYTVSDNIFSSIVAGKKYITQLLNVFMDENNAFKVSIDKEGRIIDLYTKVAENNEFVSFWMALLAREPTNYEVINVSLERIEDPEEVFLKVCSKTRSQKKLIVASHQDWEHYDYEEEEDNYILYDGIAIHILDKEEAIIELSPKCESTIIQDAIVATGHAKISKSSIT